MDIPNKYKDTILEALHDYAQWWADTGYNADEEAEESGDKERYERVIEVIKHIEGEYGK